MEMTLQNFDTTLPDLLEHIRTSDFISIDCNVETTGLVFEDETLNMDKLKGEEWYDILRRSQSYTSPLEFAVVCFKRLEEPTTPESQSNNEDGRTVGGGGTKFSVRCYNIPIFGASVDENDARNVDEIEIPAHLDIDVPGIQYIVKNGLDLNNTVYHGVPFINKENRQEARVYMRAYPDFMMLTGDDANGDLNRLYFPKVFESIEDPNDIEEILERLRGIGKFFDVTKSSRVPVVGHNLLIKLILLHKDFVENLPPTYSDFLLKLKDALPGGFYDTKYMASKIHGESKSTSDTLSSDTKLFSLYRNTSSRIGQDSVTFELQESMYKVAMEEVLSIQLELAKGSFCFEAGFRSMIAGIVFCKLATFATTTATNGRVNLSQECQNLWKNQVFIQDDLSKVLHQHNHHSEVSKAKARVNSSRKSHDQRLRSKFGAISLSGANSVYSISLQEQK